LVYGAIASVYWLYDFARAQRAPPPTLSDARIEVRGGATSLFFAPADILMVEAAGNYVEIHAAGRTHLVRGTLAAWEERLAQHNFVRAHRSRLINRARVRAIKATGSGDLEIELDDGRTVTGSRRYREGLEAV